MPLHTSSTLLSYFDQSNGVSTDTRKLPPGCMFFALKGPNFNGNVYAAKALELGASFVVVDEEAHCDSRDPRYLLVANVLEALQGLATLHRRRFEIPIFGLTGSNGKTTTKELLYAVMQQEKKVHATHGNFNNHIGVPLTLLAMPRDTEFAIVEMGANQPGDIAELAKIAEPTHGLITNVGAAHLERLGNLEGVQRTKGALFDFLKSHEGLLFVNTADHRVVAAAGKPAHKVTYGSRESAYWGETLENQLEGMRLRLHHEGESVEVHSPLSGEHNAKNIVASWAVGHHFGLSLASIQRGIAQYRAENNRSQVLHRGAFTVWLDAYNANPSSMQAAIDHLTSVDSGKVALILGDMYEVGANSPQVHQELGQHILTRGPQVVIGIGPQMKYLIEALGGLGHWFENVSESELQLPQLLAQVDTVLIKGSRAMALEKVLDYLPSK